MEGPNLIVDKSLDFSIEIIKFCESLEAEKKYIISRQLLRSGTSIGANVFEAQHAESRSDFIHKMKIAIKEANETLYWLTVCDRSESYPSNKGLQAGVEEIIRISRIILSSKGRFGGAIFGAVLAVSSFLESILKMNLKVPH